MRRPIVVRRARAFTAAATVAMLALATACGPEAWDRAVATGPCETTLRQAALMAQSRVLCRGEYAAWSMIDDRREHGFQLVVPVADIARSGVADTAPPGTAQLQLSFARRPTVGSYRVGGDSGEVLATFDASDPGVDWSVGFGTIHVLAADRAGESLTGTFDLRFAASHGPDTLSATGRYQLTTVAHDRPSVFARTVGRLLGSR